MDPWAVLGVAPGSSQEVIRAAYLRRSKELHPDLGGSDEAMQELNVAYDLARNHSVNPNRRIATETVHNSASAAPPRARPMPPPPPPVRLRRRRKPLYKRWGFWVALALVVVVLAGSGVTNQPEPGELPPPLTELVGQCIVIDGNVFTRAQSCSAPHDAKVIAVILRTEQCPAPSTSYFTVRDELVCVDERQLLRQSPAPTPSARGS